MSFTPKQVGQLTAIIDRHTHLFIGVHVGRDCLTTPMIQNLAHHGVELPLRRIPNHFDAAFRFGMLSVHPGGLVAPTFSYEKFKQYLEGGKFAPLQRREKIALNRVRRRAALDLSKLSHQILDDVTSVASEEASAMERSRAILRKLRSKAEREVYLQEYTAGLAQHATEWASRFHRIATYVMHDAFDLGRAYGLLNHYGADAEVYKDVYDGACPLCVRLYLTAGPRSEPRTFKILDLLQNGNNIGRKGEANLAVIGPTHPHCRCTLYFKKYEEDWNPALARFTQKRQVNRTYSEKVQNRRSRVKTTLTK